MITESLIRKKFVHATMNDALSLLFAAWRPAISLFKERTGALRIFAGNGGANRRITEESYRLQVLVTSHLRFLDIRYRRRRESKTVEKANLYNKLVWPILFRKVFPELQFGFTDEVRQALRDELKQTLEKE